jgi:hypothetical protein
MVELQLVPIGGDCQVSGPRNHGGRAVRLHDMILELAWRYGGSAVAPELTEIADCQSCFTNKTKGDSIHALLERMSLED